MGYFGQYTSLTNKQYIYKEFNNEQSEIVYSSIRSNIAYLALKIKKTNDIIAIVVLIRRSKKNGINEILIKDMEESQGPFYYDCPVKLLNMLTVTENIGSINWRNNCKQYHIEKKQLMHKVKALKNGDKLSDDYTFIRYIPKFKKYCMEIYVHSANMTYRMSIKQALKNC